MKIASLALFAVLAAVPNAHANGFFQVRTHDAANLETEDVSFWERFVMEGGSMSVETKAPAPDINPAPPTSFPTLDEFTSAPTGAPVPVINPAPPTGAPVPVINPAPPTFAPIPGINPAPPTGAPVPGMYPIPPTFAPIPGINPAPPTFAPIPGINPAPPTGAPVPGMYPIPPTFAPIPGINPPPNAPPLPPAPVVTPPIPPPPAPVLVIPPVAPPVPPQPVAPVAAPIVPALAADISVPDSLDVGCRIDITGCISTQECPAAGPICVNRLTYFYTIVNVGSSAVTLTSADRTYNGTTDSFLSVLKSTTIEAEASVTIGENRTATCTNVPSAQVTIGVSEYNGATCARRRLRY